MRNYVILMSATALAACGGGGGGPETVGGVAPPAGGSTQATDVYTQFSKPVEAKTYTGIGGSQVYEYNTDDRVPSASGCCGQQGQMYAGNATTPRNSPVTITYDPRDAIFTLKIVDPLSGADSQVRFQDPGNRTDFGDALEPQWGTPNLGKAVGGAAANNAIRYLQASPGDPRSRWLNSGSGFVNPGDNDTPPVGDPGASYQSISMFYELPGTNTKYVGFLGYVSNELSWETIGRPDGSTIFSSNWTLGRGAFAYGAQTGNNAVPRTGSATFTGSVLGSVVFNPLLDTSKYTPSYFQWMVGTGSHSVNFASNSLTSTFTAWLHAPQLDGTPPLGTGLPEGTKFEGAASAVIDLVNKGGFYGSFSTASFTRPDGTKFTLNIAGSSIDGAFFGPAAEEIGGGIRVVGGTPDERIDIIGAFTGKK